MPLATRSSAIFAIFALIGAHASCGSKGPGPSVAPAATATPASTSSASDGDAPEVASDGKQFVTVVERPDGAPAGTLTPGVTSAKAVVTDEQCRRAPACGNEGRCSAREGTCVAASAADCANVVLCQGQRCRLDADRCIVAASCREAYACGALGLCSEAPPEPGRSYEQCIASADDDCRASEACRDLGRCAKGDAGACVAKQAAHCQKSRACVAEGLCDPSDGACRAATDEPCKRSTGCSEGARCAARDGQCVKSCGESALCTEQGLCGERADGAMLRCAARGDADCEASAGCGKSGACSLALDGRCRPADDIECMKSSACKEQGRCAHRGGRCVARSESECKATTVACKLEGRCRFDEARGCVR